MLYVFAFLALAFVVAIVGGSYCTWNWMEMCKKRDEESEEED